MENQIHFKEENEIPEWLQETFNTEEEYDEIQREYAKYLTEVAEKGFENVTTARKSFLTDPMTFAYSLRKRPVLMLNALWDEYIPREATIDFWEACGRPDIGWFPSTHTTFWLWFPLIRRRIVHFLSSTLGGKTNFKHGR
jgi:hypothetical protein